MHSHGVLPRRVLTFLSSLALLFMALPLSNVAHAGPLDAGGGLYSLHWADWSWDTTVSSVPSPFSASSYALAITFNDAWGSLSMHTNGFSTKGYSAVAFSIRPSVNGIFPRIRALVYGANGSLVKQIVVEPYAKAASDGWFHVSIPLTDLGATDLTVTRVGLQDTSGGAQPTFYLDQFALVPPSAPSNPSMPATTMPAYASSAGAYPTGSHKPSQASTQVDNAIRAAVAKYNLPRWFYYAIIQRESSFNPSEFNGRDQGLTQLGGSWYNGMAYPEWLSNPDDNHRQYSYDMNFARYGRWIQMSKVSWMNDPYDPKQNLDRFSTGYAVPAFHLFKRWYGLSDTEALRAVAFHWNKGVQVTYDPKNFDYLGLYDKYIDQFKPICESQDGVWNGRPVQPIP